MRLRETVQCLEGLVWAVRGIREVHNNQNCRVRILSTGSHLKR